MKRVAAALLALVLARPVLAQSVATITYATDAGSDTWRMQVVGNRVVAFDAHGAPQWSVSPSNGAATDCAGVIQFMPLLEDGNGDGLIDAQRGERARLFISSSWRDSTGWQSAVLALDVSRRGAAHLQWRRDGDALTQLARLVAAPTPLRLALFPRSTAVLLGAGLPSSATSTHGARAGAALLLLDAASGATLWMGAASAAADQRIPTLNAGISGAVTALDLDRDGYADRLYVGDARASLWRFDVSAHPRAGPLLAGGEIARYADPAAPTARSIVAAPDVTLLAPPGAAAWFNLTVGTAHLVDADPGGTANASVSQALFVLRDRHPFDARTQQDYDGQAPVRAADLPRVTGTADAPPADAAGFQIDTGADSIVARALTASGVLLYTQLARGAPLDACAAALPTVIVKVSAVSALDGQPALDLDANGHIDTADHAVALPAGNTGMRDGPQLERGADGALHCLVGTTVLAACPRIPRLTRRYWRREDAD